MTTAESSAGDGTLARLHDQLRRSQGAAADETRLVGPGRVARTPSLPWVWSLNHLRVSEPISFPDLLAVVDEVLSGLPYRHVLVEHEATADQLQGPLREAGWTVDTEVIMVIAEQPDREDDTSAITELTEDQMLVLMREWLIEERAGISEEALDQIDEYNRREGRLLGERRFGFVDEQGSPLAITKLRIDGPIAWVEDVYTTPEARGRGYARSLVTNAVALSAGSELTFIVADDNDWPKTLYQKIGFRPVGRFKTFHLDLRQGS
jgi:GNAT superfamily N-acetyltransferase